MTGLDRIPAHLRAELDHLLPFARALDHALAELCERYDRLDSEWNTDAHPTLGDAKGDLDPELVDSAGLGELEVLISAMKMRASVARPDDPYPERLARYEVKEWGLDRYEDPDAVLLRTLAYMERCGVISGFHGLPGEGTQ